MSATNGCMNRWTNGRMTGKTDRWEGCIVDFSLVLMDVVGLCVGCPDYWVGWNRRIAIRLRYRWWPALRVFSQHWSEGLPVYGKEIPRWAISCLISLLMIMISLCVWFVVNETHLIKLLCILSLRFLWQQDLEFWISTRRWSLENLSDTT